MTGEDKKKVAAKEETDEKNYKAMEEDNLYKDLVEHSSNLIQVVDSEARFIYVNQAWLKTMKYVTEELANLTLWQIIHPDSMEHCKALFEQVITGKNVGEIEAYFTTKDGTPVAIEGSISVKLDEKGNFIHTRGIFSDVTKRKQAEEALRESEKVLNSILNNMTDVVWSISWPDYKHLYFSPALEKLYGRPAREFSANPSLFKEVTHPEDRHLTEKAIEQLLADGKAIRECRLVRPDGSIIWVNDQSKMIYDENRQPVRVDGVTRDITAQKEADMRTKEEYSLRLALLDNIPNCVALILKKDTREIVASNRAGYEIGAIPGKTCYQTSALRDDPCPFCRAPEMWESNQLVQIEIEYRGTWYEGIWAPLSNDLYVHYIFDITERKQAEEALEGSYALLRIAGDAAKFGGWSVDLASNTITWSDQVAIIHEMPVGYSPSVEEGISFYAPEWRDKITAVFSATAEEGIPYDDEMELITAKGRRIWVRTIGEAVVDDNGIITGVQGAFQDITERKQAEEEIRKLNEELEERVRNRTAQLEAANRELDAFTFSASHDLRGPLNRIRGFSDALLEDYADLLDTRGKNYLQRIFNSSQHMAELIDDLLKLSKVTQQQINREPVNLSALASAYLKELQAREPDRSVEAVVAPGLVVEGDAALLRIALENMFGNAWKYSAFEYKACFEFGCTTQEDKKVYYIRDNGTGFEMKYAKKLFAPFQRLHDAKTYPGTGIGLSIVSRIISRHGGEIWAEGEEGKGACFYFTLP